jgi:squalene-hopene/tetraprenyl-beta-curcumene cyclase
VEETALAVEALAVAVRWSQGAAKLADSHARGVGWLLDRVESGSYVKASPIGFYFAKLSYYERLYPLAFTAAALGRSLHALASL